MKRIFRTDLVVIRGMILIKWCRVCPPNTQIYSGLSPYSSRKCDTCPFMYHQQEEYRRQNQQVSLGICRSVIFSPIYVNSILKQLLNQQQTLNREDWRSCFLVTGPSGHVYLTRQAKIKTSTSDNRRMRMHIIELPMLH